MSYLADKSILFPSGGGGYLVASKLAGALSGSDLQGSALVIERLAIRDFDCEQPPTRNQLLPANWLWLKFWVCLVVIVLMVGMNLRE